jgi:hypothetical protein
MLKRVVIIGLLNEHFNYIYYAASKCKVTALGESEMRMKKGRGLF